MVQTAKARDGYNFGSGHSPWLYRSSPGRVFAQRIMDSVLMIVVEVITNQPAQVIFA